MSLTKSIAEEVYDDARTELECAQVSATIHGKAVTVLLADGTTTGEATLFGVDTGYEATIFAKLSELPQKGLNDGDIVTIDRKDYRARGVMTTAGAVRVAGLESKYRAD